MDTNVPNSDYSAIIDFLRAVKKGEIKKVKKFLGSGNFNSTILVPGQDECEDNDQPLWDDVEECGFTPLILACSNGKLKVVKLLVEAGADIEQTRYNSDEDLTPIHFAASLEILEYLLAQGADINATDLMGNSLINRVISRGDNTWASFLINRGADPTIVVDTGWGGGYDAVENAIEKKNYLILKKIFDNGVDLKPYLAALASQGLVEFVAEALAQCKLQINHKEINSALFRAAEHGHAPIVKMLIQNGADVNTKDYEEGELELCWNDYEATEITPLAIANKKAHVEVINILIAAGARN